MCRKGALPGLATAFVSQNGMFESLGRVWVSTGGGISGVASAPRRHRFVSWRDAPKPEGVFTRERAKQARMCACACKCVHVRARCGNTGVSLPLDGGRREWGLGEGLRAVHVGVWSVWMLVTTCWRAIGSHAFAITSVCLWKRRVDLPKDLKCCARPNQKRPFGFGGTCLTALERQRTLPVVSTLALRLPNRRQKAMSASERPQAPPLDLFPTGDCTGQSACMTWRRSLRPLRPGVFFVAGRSTQWSHHRLAILCSCAARVRMAVLAKPAMAPHVAPCSGARCGLHSSNVVTAESVRRSCSVHTAVVTRTFPTPGTDAMCHLGCFRNEPLSSDQCNTQAKNQSSAGAQIFHRTRDRGTRGCVSAHSTAQPRRTLHTISGIKNALTATCNPSIKYKSARRYRYRHSLVSRSW